MADFTASSSPLSDLTADVLLLPLLTADDGGAPQVPGHDSLSETAQALGAAAKAESLTRIPSADVTSAGSIGLVGLGASSLEEVDAEHLRMAFGAAARALHGTGSVAVALPGAGAEQLLAAAQGVGLGAYQYTAFKTDAEETDSAPISEVIVVAGDADAEQLSAGLERIRHEVGAVHIARDLVNTPPNLLFPQSFAERVQELATDLPLEVTVLDETELKDGGYGGIIGVGQGSARPPRLVRIAYTPQRAEQHVAFVGKGITFDTGGISLKPGANMDEMTSDMGGAATVLAVTLAAARLELPVQVTTFLALAENMPSGGAQRPGDVVTMRNGKTVEVLNTDAEGRMVMADALVDAAAEHPDLIIDVATLTGAAVVALGDRTAGVLGNDGPRGEVVAAADVSGEPIWPMPMPEELRAKLTGRVADLRNIGERPGGMLSAAVFLAEFVDGVPWAHIDIAGPAYTTSPYGYIGKGGTGFSVRTLVEMLHGSAF